MDIIISVIIFVLFAIALIGIFIPFVPGVFLAWLAFLLYVLTEHILRDHVTLFVILTVLTLIALFSDTIFSLIGAKAYNSGKFGVMGGVAGFVIGLFFPPIGPILGPLIGVYLGEIAGGKTPKQAVRSFWGALMGFLFSIGLKLAVWVTIFISILYLIVF